MNTRIWASLLAASVTLSGCQFLPTFGEPSTPSVKNPPAKVQAKAANKKPVYSEPGASNCYVGYDRLNGIFAAQRVYLVADSQKRISLLNAAEEAKDFALKALLMSQPNASPAELQMAIDTYMKQPISPSRACPGDRYIALREAQAQYLLEEKNRALTLQKEVSQLKDTLKTLNRIEDSLVHDLEFPQ